MLVSCLLPTYGRMPFLRHLLEEAVECFLRQIYPDKELLILNDCPQQTLQFSHPQVRVINANHRFPTLGDKLHWMMEQAQGEYICRWDDDDISLPWRLSYSVGRLTSPPKKEWRPENHWYAPGNPPELKLTTHPGNTHIMAIWNRCLIRDIGMKYPGRSCPSGLEDQTFTSHLRALGYPNLGDLLPPEDMFYLYRWNTGSKHLSGAGGGEVMQQSYEQIGNATVYAGNYVLQPSWRYDYVDLAKRAAAALRSPVSQPATGN